MPEIIPNNCCGFFTVEGFSCDNYLLNDFLSYDFAKHVSFCREKRFDDKVEGKMYQCILASDQWSTERHKLLKKHGWVLVNKWKNSSGSLLRAYQYVTEGAEREMDEDK